MSPKQKANEAAADVQHCRLPIHGEYKGMSYEDASRRGHELVKAAARSGCWFLLPEHLVLLAAEMIKNNRKVA